MCHLISNLKSIFSNFTQGFGSFAKVVVTAFLLGSLSVSSFATTTVGESSDFNAMSNATWKANVVLALKSDGASSQVTQTLSINVTGLPDGGANYRVYKTTANGGDFFATPVALALGVNSISVASVDFDRAVKFQVSSADIRFDALTVNGVQLY